MTRRRKLLLADDSPTIQKVISLTFADEGVEVVTAADGREALRQLEVEPPPDVLLADAVMPGPNGYELCEHVKRDERLRHIPVVLLVGTFEPFNEAEARRVGADTVLTKPFQSIRDLVSKVGALLGGESKPEAEERGPSAGAEEGHRELAAEVQTRGREVTTESAPATAAAGSGGTAAPADPDASFADLGADDEMIEVRPADPSDAVAAPRAGTPEPAPTAAAAYDPAPYSFAAEEGARPAFAAHSAGLAAADDTLLDLGQIEPPSADAAAEADDFILDLDDDFAAPPADPAGAFAEAAHGERAVDFGAETWRDVPSPSAARWESRGGEPDEAARTPFEFSALPAETEARDPEVAREVVGSEPPPFVSGHAGDAHGAKEFIEPQVVAADEPAPAGVAGEFTDGSVEGDMARPAAPFTPETPSTPQPAFPEPPSTAGYAMGEARTGVAEVPPAEQLSPEAIEAIARRVVELMSEKVVREVAWEVVPDLAELLIKQRLDEERKNRG